MICVSWGFPSPKKQQGFLERARAGGFNYDETFIGNTQKEPFTQDQKDELRSNGYALNNLRVQLGTGEATFLKAKESLKKWRHFQLGWASVDPSTPVQVHQQFCVRVNELFTWIITPLEILYVNEFQSHQKGLPSRANTKGYFAFGSGTLKGHLLAGEEMFAVKWEEDDSVWYEILSFAKPAEFLSKVTYPYVRWRQRLFARQSSNAMARAVSEGGKV